MPDSTGAADLSALPAAMQQSRRASELRPERPGVTRQAEVRQVPGGAEIKIQVSEEPQRFYTPEAEARWQAIRAQREENNQRIHALSTLGLTVLPAALVDVRVSVLLEMLWPWDTQKGQGHRLEYEARLQDRLDDLLWSSEKVVHQARLAAGAQIPPPAMERLAAEAGLPVPGAQRQPGH